MSISNNCQGSSGCADIYATVARNQPACERYWQILLRLPKQAQALYAHFTPGQFVLLDLRNLGVPDEVPSDLVHKADRSVILRRPFSPMQVQCGPDGVEIELLYKVVGPATIRMTSLRPGQSLRLLGPLGKGFRIGPAIKIAILVAGGIGLPPIHHLSYILKRDRPTVRLEVFIGAKTANDLPFLGPDGRPTRMQGMPIHLTSEDGSIGTKGLVTECLLDWLAGQTDLDPGTTVICGCGPAAMLTRLARIAMDKGLSCQISLESYMACGIGLCQGCVVPCKGKDGPDYRLCCQDGPVFDAGQVDI